MSTTNNVFILSALHNNPTLHCAFIDLKKAFDYEKIFGINVFAISIKQYVFVLLHTFIYKYTTIKNL